MTRRAVNFRLLEIIESSVAMSMFWGFFKNFCFDLALVFSIPVDSGNRSQGRYSYLFHSGHLVFRGLVLTAVAKWLLSTGRLHHMALFASYV